MGAEVYGRRPLQPPVFRHYEQPIVPVRLHLAKRREAPERRQDGTLFPDHEAGQGLALQAPANQGDPGMRMAGERIGAIHIRRLVPQDERWYERRRIHTVDLQIVWRIARVAVVVFPPPQGLRRTRPGPPPAPPRRG